MSGSPAAHHPARSHVRLVALCAAFACALLGAPAALAAPSAPTGLTATTPTNLHPSLSWTAPTDGTGTVTYNVWRGATKLTTTAVSGTSYVDPGGIQGSSPYTVTATDSTGTSPPSAPFSVVYDTVAPPAATTLTATTPTNVKPVLSWVSGGNDATSGFVAYQVLRGGTTVLGTTTATTFTDTALVTSGSQSYTVKTFDAAGNASTSAAKAVVYDTVLPSAPTLTAPVATATSTTLTWSASTDTGGSTMIGYTVFRDGVLIGAPTPATSLTFTDTTAMATGSYAYTVYAHDGAGNSSLASNVRTVVYDATPPAAPTGLAAPTPTNAAPVLLWTGSSDTGGSGVQHYDVYRDGTLAGSSTVTNFTDSAAGAGVHVYTVKAVDGANNASAASTSTTVDLDKTAPSVPATLTATSPTASNPVLSWTASTDSGTGASGLDHYDLYRSGVKINSSPITGTSFTDTNPSTTSQSYYVKAVDAAGNTSAQSPTKTVIYDVTSPSAPTVTVAPATSVDPSLGWLASSDLGGALLAGYRVYRDGALISTTTATSYTEPSSSVAPGTYVYSVVAYDNAGNVSATIPHTVVVDKTAPSTPTNVSALSPTKPFPVITWTAADDGSGSDSSGIAHYEIVRSGVVAGSSTTTSFTDASATPNSSLSYTVVAIDAAGNRSVASSAVPVVYDTTSPPVPTNIGGLTPTGAVPTVTWTSGGGDNLSGLDYYAVYRGSTLIGKTTGTTTSFTDSLLATAGSQAYTVKAVDLAGNQSAATSARTIVFDPIPPGQPGRPTVASPTNDPKPTWSAATDTGGSNINHYDVYRTIGGITTLAGSTPGTTYDDQAVPGDGSYTYTVVAVDGAGNQSVPSAGTVAAVDVNPPSAPTGLTGAALTATRPSLSWGLSVDGSGGSGILRYDVYRGATFAGSSSSTTFIDTNLSSPGSYAYTVKAVDAAGNVSAASAPFTATWDNVAPPVPINLTATTPTNTAPVLSWQSGGSAPDFAQYNVYRGGVLIWSGTATTYEDDDPTLTSSSLAYTVKAVDALNNASPASIVKTIFYDITPPVAVATLTGSSPVLHPSLTWGASTDTGGAGFAGYRVYRNGTQIGQTGSTITTYTDSALAVDGTYSYTVSGIDNAGNVGPASPIRSIQVDQTPPPAPTGIVAPSPTRSVTLTWPATPDTGASGSGVVRYRIYRNGVPLTTVPTPTYTDTTLAIEGPWSYTISAIDATGNEGVQSAPVSVVYDGTPPPKPLSLIVSSGAMSINQPTLAWASGGPDALSGFDHYEIWRDGALAAQTTAPTFTDSNLPDNGTHNYYVRAVDAAGNTSVQTSTVSAIWDNSAPAVPSSINVPTPTNRPTLTWATSVDVGGANGVTYAIFRDGSQIATTSSTTFQDTTVPGEGTYTYTIVAADQLHTASVPSLPYSVAVDTTPPDAVNAPTGDSPTLRPVLTWPAASDPSGISHYDVYRGATLAGSPVTDSFTDQNVSLDGSYAYTVIAVDGAGNRSPASLPTTILFDHTPPPAPTPPQAPTPTRALPTLVWATGGPDVLSGFDHYAVFRDGILAGTSTSPSFVDADIATIGPHAYTVRSVDAAGNLSAASRTINVVYDTAAPPTPADITAASPTSAPALSWTASNDDSTGGSGVVGYHVYRDGVLIASPTAPSFADTSISISGAHAYWVTAIDAVGNESPASPTKAILVDLDPPDAPADLAAGSPTRRPSLTWGAATDVGPGAVGIDHYNVYRDGTLVARTTTTTFVDTHVTASGEVTYSVRAVDLAGNVGAPSIPLAVVVDVTGPTLEDLTIPHDRLAGQAITFSVSATDPQGSLVADPVWTFGSGAAKGGTVTHVFQKPGVYSVSVTATDALGNTTTSAPTTIKVLPPLSKVKIATTSSLTLKTLKKHGWRIQATLTMNGGGTVTVTLAAGKRIVAQTKRNVPDGQTPVLISVPRANRKRGTYTLAVTISGSKLKSTARIRLR